MVIWKIVHLIIRQNSFFVSVRNLMIWGEIRVICREIGIQIYGERKYRRWNNLLNQCFIRLIKTIMIYVMNKNNIWQRMGWDFCFGQNYLIFSICLIVSTDEEYLMW